MGGDNSKSSSDYHTVNTVSAKYENKSKPSNDNISHTKQSTKQTSKSTIAISRTLYVLKLTCDKYYVGTTSNMDIRYKQHQNGDGSEWTKLYPPKKILYTKPMVTSCDEDNETKLLMAKYGIENVRGGSYVSPKLSYNCVKFLKAEICTMNNTCFVCGKAGHFAKDCDKSIDKTTDKSSVKMLCSRCGRNSHTKEHCYAKTHLNGKRLNS